MEALRPGLGVAVDTTVSGLQRPGGSDPQHVDRILAGFVLVALVLLLFFRSWGRR